MASLNELLAWGYGHVWLPVAPVLTGLGAMSLALLALNVLFARKLKADAWVQANPRLAGLIDMARGAGIEPWNVLRGAERFVRAKLPDRIERVIDMLSKLIGAGLLALLLTHCPGNTPDAHSADVAKRCMAFRNDIDLLYAYELGTTCAGLTVAECEVEHTVDFAALKAQYAAMYDDAARACARGES